MLARLWSSIKHRLASVLGEAPGAYFVAALWGMLILTVSIITAPIFLSLGDATSRVLGSGPLLREGVTLSIFNALTAWLLPLALFVTLGHRLVTHPQATARRSLWAGLTLALAIIAYLAPSNLLVLPRLFGLPIPEPVDYLARGAWPLGVFGAILGLALTRRPHPPAGLKIIVLAMLAGALMSVALAYPAYTLIFNTFNLGLTYTGSTLNLVALISGFVSLLTWLAVGPLAIRWVQPQSRWGRWMVGAAAGALTGGFVFGLMGAPLAGVWAQAPLYGFTLTRTGYESGEWLLKLALANINLFPATLGLTGLCLGGGGLLGGITGLFTPRRTRAVPVTQAVGVLYEISVGLGMLLILTLCSIAAVVSLDVLPRSLQNYFTAYGFIPRWPTAWLQPAFAIQYLVAILAFQVLGLVAIARSYKPLAAQGSRSTTSFSMALDIIAVVGVGVHLALYYLLPTLYQNPAIITLALIAIGLSVELWLALRRAGPLPTPSEITPADSSPAFAWAGAGMVVGLLTGMLAFQLLGIALSLTLVSVVFISPLAGLGEPPGVAWLEQTVFNPLFVISPAVFTLWALWTMVSGYSTSPSSPRLTARPGPNPFGQRLAALWNRTPRWTVDALAVAAAVIVAWTTREVLSVVIVSLLASFSLLRRRWERPTWAIAALAFVIVLFGVVGLTLGGVFTDSRPVRLMYLLLGPASLLALRALTAYAPENQHTRLRLTALIGLAMVVGLLSYVNQTQTLRQGGVSRYDGQQWEAFDSANSALGIGLNYELYQDSRGRLWFGSGAIAATHDAQGEKWQRYFLRSISTGNSLTTLSEPSATAHTLFREDSQGRLWVASGNAFGQLDPGLTTSEDYVREPSQYVCSQGVMNLWDKSGEIAAIFFSRGEVNIISFAFNAEGTHIVTTDASQTVKIWETATGRLLTLLTGPTVTMRSAQFSPDGTWVVAAGDGQVWIWEVGTGRVRATLEGQADFRWATFSPDGKWVMGAAHNSVWVWEAGVDFEPHILIENSGEIFQAEFSPDGERLVVASGDDTARVWATDTGQLLVELSGHTQAVTSAIFSPDGMQILTASRDGTARLWNTHTGAFLASLETRRFASFSPDGRQIVTAGDNRTVQLWDADTGQLILTLPNHAGRVREAAFSPDGTQVLVLTSFEEEYLWDARTGQLLTIFPASEGHVSAAGFTPDGQHIITAGCFPLRGNQILQLGAPVTQMTLDIDGYFWLATDGDGMYRLDVNRQPENTTWEHFSSANIANLSNNIHNLYADQAGNLWAATDKGLNLFDGVRWGRPLAPTGLSQSAEVVFLEDRTGQLWTGTPGGLFHWDGDAWTTANGWPEGLGVTALFEDKVGDLWAGTGAGARRFDGSDWTIRVPEVAVTKFAEGADGMVWVGAQSGLFRFDPATGKTDSFTSANSGLATNAIQDVLVDVDGEVWVSTFTVEQTPGSPWAGLAAAVIFFGYLSVQTYRYYDRAPESRARRLNRQIDESPDSLYPTIYALLANASEPAQTLTQLARYRAQAEDAVSAEAIRAIVALTTEPRLNLAANLNRSAAALEADAARAGTLHPLHGLLSRCLAARLIADLTRLELSVDPSPEAGNVAIRTREVTVNGLPAFARTGMADAWRALEKVGVVLRKYQEVDTAADRLSFLADALTAAEAAETAAQLIKSPEGHSLVSIAAQWRAIVTYEINLISGRAELRLELRTRQARRAEQVTVALRLQNIGRATAENVSLTLQPGDGFTLEGDSRVVLDRLPSGRSQPIEFTLCPAQSEFARIACRVTWDDRMGTGNQLEFADALRFYEVTEAFTRIPNPYIVGHPVKSPEMFQGRADVFEFIRDNLSGPTQDRTIVLHGQRRTGKTSILYQLVQGRLGSGFVPVLIDMQEVALLINGTADFLNEVAYQLARAIRKAGLAQEPPEESAFAAAPTRTFSRFLDTVEDTLGERKAVLIFDEFELIEGKIAEGKLEADLLNYFRSLIQHRQRLVFIFTGTHRLEEMSHNYWSILFNLALYRRVSFLTPADTAKLIRQPVAGALDVDALAVEKIVALTRGHAYFTQLICWALVNHCNTNERNYATLNDVNDAVQEILASGEAHFAYIWQQANPTERLALAAVAHTIRPGKDWARPAEILETLAEGGGSLSQAALVEMLDQLTRQDVLESASDGALRYRFQIEVLRLWVEATKSVTALVERDQ